MPRDDAFLLDIVQSARIALSYVQDVEEAAFNENPQLQDSVIRRLEIIGEAARRLSEETRASLPEVPWRSVIGMRNLMIHDYDDVDITMVWDSVQQGLPQIIAQILPHLPPEPEA